MDYCNIDPGLGTMDDFKEFMKKAGELNIRVIMDLVLNHTSDQHEWFKQARSDKNSRYRNYYIWSEERPENFPYPVAFEGEQDHVWSFDEKAGEFYLHRFYKEQPDLNIRNPEVKGEIRKIINFWLDLGIAGFRIDAAHILVELDQSFDKMEENFNILNFLNTEASKKREVMLLAEANDEAQKISEYFGKGDRMNVLFNFLLNQEIFLALANQNSNAIRRVTEKIPLKPQFGCWLNFIRHHDELTLDKLSNQEIEEVFRAFAPEKDMQIFGKGIRRRLPPMLHNNRTRIELVFSLNFSLPGIPMIRYGDEIGMGDNLSLPGRESVRTSMQWSNTKNGGFSDADSEKLIRPVISDGDYAYSMVNVEKQHDDPHSLLNWIKNLIRIRKECKEITSGVFNLEPNNQNELLIHTMKGEERTFMAIHNLSDKVMKMNKEQNNGQLVFSDNQTGNPEEISGYGYKWIMIPNKI
jgi:maltose alpha-D-glucosyltransferase/alpha-amylase